MPCHVHVNMLLIKLPARVLVLGVAMDVTFVCSGEEPFKMEVGFFDTVQDIKQKLQGCKDCPGPAAALSLSHNGDVLADVLDGAGVTERYGIVEGSVIHVALADDVRRQRHQHRHQQQLQQKTEKNKKPSSKRRPLRVTVVSRCGAGRVEVAVGAGARGAVSALRGELEERARGDGTPAFPLPRDGAYFFIHRQSVMDEARSFEWHGVADGDEVVVFDGSVTRGAAPAAWSSLGSC